MWPDDGTITDGFCAKNSVFIAIRCLYQVLIEIRNLPPKIKLTESASGRRSQKGKRHPVLNYSALVIELQMRNTWGVHGELPAELCSTHPEPRLGTVDNWYTSLRHYYLLVLKV